MDNGMKKGNWGLVLLECGCTVGLIQEPRMEDNPPVVMWSTHGIVVTKVMIQILERVVFLIIKKRWVTFCNNSYSF